MHFFQKASHLNLQFTFFYASRVILQWMEAYLRGEEADVGKKDASVLAK